MSIADKSTLDKALSHMKKEIGFPNIRISLKSNYEAIQKAHDSIHEFVYLAPLCLPSKRGASWHPKSAFLTYQWEAFHQAHRSFLEALSGYYNAAYILLRSTLELLVKGAFWECMAHESLREKAALLDKVKGERKSLKDWVKDLIEQKPSLKKELEEMSGAIFDKSAILFTDREFQEQFVVIPTFKVIVKQLIAWGVLDIPNAFDVIYDNLYRDLSKNVHVVPDATDMGRRLLAEKDFMKIEVIPGELAKYMKTLHELVDIGIVIELNIIRDWIELGDKTILKERLATLEDLGLHHSVTKLKALTSMGRR
jgi:hypothetical protein